MLVRLLTTKLCKDSCIRRNDEVSDHQRPPLADEAQRNSGISLIVVNMHTSRYIFVFRQLVLNKIVQLVIIFEKAFTTKSDLFFGDVYYENYINLNYSMLSFLLPHSPDSQSCADKYHKYRHILCLGEFEAEVIVFIIDTHKLDEKSFHTIED